MLFTNGFQKMEPKSWGMFCSAHLWSNSASPAEQRHSHIALSTECCGNLSLNFHCYRIWTTLTLSSEVAPGPPQALVLIPLPMSWLWTSDTSSIPKRDWFIYFFFFFPLLSHAVFLGHNTHSTSPLTCPGVSALHSLWRMVWQRRHPECLDFHPFLRVAQACICSWPRSLNILCGTPLGVGLGQGFRVPHHPCFVLWLLG